MDDARWMQIKHGWYYGELNLLLASCSRIAEAEWQQNHRSTPSPGVLRVLIVIKYNFNLKLLH